LAAARLAFEQRDMTRGCSMIADARTSVGSSDVELRNQIEYYGGRCPASASAPATGPAVVASGAPAASPPAASPPPVEAPREPKKKEPAKPTTSTPAASRTDAVRSTTTKLERSTTTKPDTTARAHAATVPPRGTWTIQLAAYNTRPDAERLVAKLAGRGVKARISGEAKPFRVRLDYYATQQDAAAAVAELKQRGIIGFVTEEPGPRAGSSP
jgi:cell division protein FtsN